MANIDQLSIEITSDSHKAEAAINDLVKGLTNLENTLNKLDVSKITAFSNAVSKLSNIGANTNTTTKAIKGMANEIASSFGIRTKKGISDITEALMQLYEVNKNQKLGFDVGTEYDSAVNKVQKAIEANYKYKTSVDSTTQSVKDYVTATNKAGETIGMADMAQEYGENFKEMAKVLGSAFKNKLDSTKEGVSDLAEYLSEMNSQLGTQFDVDNVERGFAQLVETVRGAKSEVLDFSEATKQGLISNNASYDATISALMQIEDLLREQEKYGATSGLGGVISAFQQLSNYSDLSGLNNGLKEIKANAPTDTAKAVSSIGDSADKATAQVEKLNNVLSQSKTVIEGNEIKEHGFTMKDAPEPKNVEYPPAIIEQAQAYEEKLLPAIIDTQNQIDALYERMMSLSSTEAIYDAITQKFIEMKTQLMEMNGAISGDKWIVPEFKGNADFNRQQTGWISNIKPEVVEGYFYEIENSANKCLPAIVNVGETALVTADHFSKLGESVADYSEVIATASEGTDESARKIAAASEKAAEATNKMKAASEKPPKVEGHDLIRDLEEISIALKELSEAFETLASKGEKIFKILTTPLKLFANEYIEKFENMSNGVKNFQKKIQAHMTKLSQFWKRTMKTFTFMLVRKAITEIIKEVGNAIQSLAMFSNAMGTAFNTDISHMIADFQYLGRSIVSIFAPLLNIVVPIIDAIVNRIAVLLSYIGMLVAALGGSASFTRAKKNVDNYAESLDSASKSAKKLTMGIDELNILNDSGGSGSAKPYDGWENAWEEVDIPTWIKDLSSWLKDFWKKFFDPLLEAWNRAKQYLIDGFKTMLDSLKRLFGHIADDFLEVWNQAKTIRMFEQMIKIVGDLTRVVRNLADQFDKAWQKGKVGLKIFENLRDIMAILVDHARNVSYYMVEWSKKIDFTPLLSAFEKLTSSLKFVADFIGGVFEDVMKNGVLKYIQYMIEEAIPHLMHVIAEIIEAFNFATLRERLKPVWIAFEEMFENIHKGTTNALGNLGKEIAVFVNSDDFAKFLERIAEVTKVLTAERVEKVLTGLGEGILNIGKAVVKFVNSDIFMKFIKAIGDWIDKKSTKDIAKTLEALAKAILIFKFGAFTTSKLAGFFKFFSVITVLKDLKAIASGMTNVAKASSALGATAPKIGALYNPLWRVTNLLSKVPSILSSIPGNLTLGNLTNMIGAFKNLKNVIGAKNIFFDLTTSVNSFAASLSPLTVILGSLTTGFMEFKVVSGAVEELTYGTDNLTASIGKLAAGVGIAGVAFTALLGFPAGIIATGVVAAVAAIKGIQDAVDQINFDVLNEAITTGGDTTIAQAKEWYEQATSIVSEQTAKWTDDSRNLIQAGEDIQHYLQTISELSTVLNSSKDATVLMIDTLTGKYKDLQSSIDNYIDESTNSLVANLLAQKSYLEAQGFNVNQMILDIYTAAEGTKNAVSEATKSVEEAAKKYSEAVETYGYGSKEAEAALKEYEKASAAAEHATSQFSQEMKDVKTDELVAEIKELGDSLDLSQYAGDPEGAVTAIQQNIDELRTTYVAKMKELKKARDDEIKAVNENPLYSEEQKAAEIASIEKTFSDMSDTLTTETGKVFDLYQNTISDKVTAIADTASKTWDEKGGLIFGYKTKGEYIHAQVESFVDSMLGEEGMEGSINKLYAEMPGKVNDNVVAAMDGIVDKTWQEFTDYTSTNGIYQNAQGVQLDYYQKLVDQVDKVDYNTPASTFANNSWNTIMDYARGLQYDQFGNVVMGGAAQSITASKQQFEDANRLVSGEGANALAQGYKDTLQPLADAMKEQGVEYGKGIDSGFVEGIRSADEQGGIKAEIDSLFTNINKWVHDNPLMPFGSPNKKTTEYGQELVQGFSSGIDTEIKRGSVNRSIIDIFTRISQVMRTQMDTLKTNFKTKISELFNLSSADVSGPVNKIFTTVKTTINTAIDAYGNELLSTTLPTFMQSYIFPFFNVEMWQPLFDNLLNMVFIPFFETFKTWFTEEAMTPWWEEDLLSWFADDKWNEDIFDPLTENIQSHWDEFSSWWDTTITEWWETQVVPWFAQEKWKEQFMKVHDTADDVLKQINELLKEAMKKAEEIVLEACETMQEALDKILNTVQKIVDGFKDFKGFNGKFSFNMSPNEYASGGFPAYGSLFVAGEPGAGAEFVGNIGGRTGVVSNDEITGIADAVYATGYNEAELLGQLVTIARAVLDKDPVVLGDREIARMANAGQSKLGMSIIT